MAVKINKDNCAGCGSCVEACPVGALSVNGDKVEVKESECIECGACTGACPCDALSL